MQPSGGLCLFRYVHTALGMSQATVQVLRTEAVVMPQIVRSNQSLPPDFTFLEQQVQMDNQFKGLVRYYQI